MFSKGESNLSEAWVSSKTETTPILVSKGTSQNGALQLLAEQYKKRLERIHGRLHDPKRTKPVVSVTAGAYYRAAEAAVRALYADAT
jgi:hypothetical protein